MNSGLPLDERHSFRARWLFPLDGQPIENGTVEITRGRISAIHDRHDPRARDLGNVAIIPGLVNAHTHLEFSDLSRPLGPADSFTEWVRAVVDHRRNRKTDRLQLVRQGLCECADAGTTALGEITTDEASLAALDERGPAVCAFRESIGFLAEQIDEQLQTARRFLDAVELPSQARVTRGLSPHAPYSVHPELFARLVDLATEKRAPVAIHLAETRAEIEFLDRGTGPFLGLLQNFGVWKEDVIPRGSRPLDYLRSLQRLDRALVVHGNYLSDEEISFVAERPHLTVVYCPRTHAYFGHEAHPWQQLLSQGGSVAIGTDSRASNPDLSLWRELCFLHSHFPRVAPATLLKLGTAAGARALNLPGDDWCLKPGGAANLAVISLGSTAGGEPYALLFDERNSIRTAMGNGAWYGPLDKAL
ncbi:MAG: amidohydrolase family protein [Planctomycetaceae bacterium]